MRVTLNFVRSSLSSALYVSDFHKNKKVIEGDLNASLVLSILKRVSKNLIMILKIL